MTSKQIALVLGAVLFTFINLLVLATNWSMTAHAKVAGMDFSRLEVALSGMSCRRWINPTGGETAPFEARSRKSLRAVVFLTEAA